jgi:2-amino-4-hydroxy-6-hydroxymethyldihydropteridine diphosphokinase
MAEAACAEPAFAFLALGSNLGDRKALIDGAVAALAAIPGIAITARSSYYRTEPVGPIAQDWFVNGVIAVETGLSPADLLAACHAVERQFGRDRARELRWGPRLIDIDLIAYDDLVLAEAGLELPHPRYAERAFVLVPLHEIAPDGAICGRPIARDWASVDRSGVERLAWTLPVL